MQTLAGALPSTRLQEVGGGARGLRVPWCPAPASGPRDALRRAGRGASWAMLRALRVLGARPPCGPWAPLLQLVRGRKTRHDPPAKSKLGRVTTPPAVDPVEFFVLTERYRQYRQTVRALRCVRLKGRRASAPWAVCPGGRRGCRLWRVSAQA